MSNELRSLIVGSFRRLRPGNISALLWLLMVGVAILPVVIAEFSYRIDRDQLSGLGTTLLFTTMLAVLVFGIFVYWKFTRALADYQDRNGDFLPWLSWTLVAYIPLFLFEIAQFTRDFDTEHFILQTTAYLFLSCTAVPVLVHASGRAIDDDGPDFFTVTFYWWQRYLVLFVAGLIVMAPFVIFGDWIASFVSGNISIMLVSAIGTVLAYSASSVFMIALTVEAFHRVPETQAS